MTDKIKKIAQQLENEIKPKCVILGGVHGDDKLGLGVLTYYFKHNNPLFQLVLGNHLAMKEGKKFIDFDLMLAGKGDITCTTSVEKCRAAEIHEILEQFDYVVDIHGSHFNDDCLIITKKDKKTLRFAKAFGIKKVIYVDPDNYLTSTVPYNVTLIKKIEAKPDPTDSEVADVVLTLDKLEKFFNKEDVGGEIELYEIMDVFDDPIDYIINHDVSIILSDNILKYK